MLPQVVGLQVVAFMQEALPGQGAGVPGLHVPLPQVLPGVRVEPVQESEPQLPVG